MKNAYPEKYQTLIDQETWDFIEATNEWYPPDAIDYSIGQQREVYDRMCREFYNGLPEGIKTRDEFVQSEQSIPIRRYFIPGSKPQAQIIYYHGGGFVVGGLESHDDVCAELCQRTGFDVVSVDYRLVPEHPHPAGFDDALDVWHHIAWKPKMPILLAGDSAGGNLVAAISHEVRGQDVQPVGQLLIYPGLGGDITSGSYIEHAEAPMLTTADIKFYSEIRKGGHDVVGDTSYAPLWDKDFSNLPPTVVISAECDPLSDDGDVYCKLINKAGGKAHWVNEQGLVHGYLRARHTVSRARDSFTRIIDSAKMLGEGKWD